MKGIRFIGVLLAGFAGVAWADPPPLSPELKTLLHTYADQVEHDNVDSVALESGVHGLADNGDPVAQFLAGMLFSRKDKAAAARYLHASATGGCAGAAAMLGVLAMQAHDSATGLPLIQSAAAQGDAASQIALSGMYARGDYGLPKSKTQAYAWLRLAEQQTYASSTQSDIHELLNVQLADLSPEEKARADAAAADLARQYPKVDYYLCGQMVLEDGVRGKTGNPFLDE